MSRVVSAWRELPQERRLAALACGGLFLALFLPWYQETVFANGVTSLRSASSSLTGWGAFSFVEAAVLLVAASVLVLLFTRAEGQAFHVPGGDGGVITAAGLWTCVLIIWRIFDKQGTSRHGQIAYTSGIEWGIFVALGVAAVLTYSGSQIRLAHEPEPPLPGDPSASPADRRRRRRARQGAESASRRPSRAPRAYPGPDMGADETWTQEFRAIRTTRPEDAELPATRAPEPEAPTAKIEAPTAKVEASAAPTRRMRPRSIAAGPDPGRRARALDRSEIRELDIAEPPTARLGRHGPPAADSSEADTQRQTRRPQPPDPAT